MDKTNDYKDALTKIAQAYDGSRGGRIWEDAMRTIAREILEKHGESPFVKVDKSQIVRNEIESI